MGTHREVAANRGAGRAGWLLFLGILLLVVLGSAVVLVQRLTPPLQETSGTIIQLDERRPGLNRTVYGLTLESQAGEQLFLRLRNQGRILPYLREADTEGAFTVEHRAGEVIALTDAAEGVTIEEREAPLPLYGVALLLASAVLLLVANALRNGWLLGTASGESGGDMAARMVAFEEEE